MAFLMEGIKWGPLIYGHKMQYKWSVNALGDGKFEVSASVLKNVI